MSLNPSASIPIVKKLMHASGMIIIPSRGYSMYPVIRPADECLFSQVTEEQLRIGDILLFGDGSGSFVGHRLIRIEGKFPRKWYVCKGDTNRFADQPVPFDSIIGCLSSIERKRGTAQSSSISSQGRGMLLWGKIIIKFPFLSVILHKIVNSVRSG